MTFAAAVVLAAALWLAGRPRRPRSSRAPARRTSRPPTRRRCSAACSSWRIPSTRRIVEQATYDFYIKTPRTDSSQDRCGRPTTRTPSRPTSGTSGGPSFLDNLWIEVIDEPYENGVMGKHVIFHIEERPRLKVVDYVPAVGTKMKVEISKIEEALREQNVELKARRVHRRDGDPPREERHPRASTPRRATTTSRSRRRSTELPLGPQARAPDVHDRRRARVQDSRSRASTATRRSATASCAAR